VLAAIIFGVVIGWEFRIRNFDDIEPYPNTPRRTIGFEVNLVSVDPTVGTMIVDWFIVNDTACNGTNMSICTEVDIFFDTNLLRLDDADNSTTPSNGLPTNPIFHWIPSVQGDHRANLAAFRTTIALFSRERTASTLQAYPFDVYSAQIFIFAQVSGTNDSVKVIKAMTQGIAVGFTAMTEHHPDDESSATLGFINDSIVLRRNVLVKAYALVIVVGVWLITLLFLVSTISLTFGYHQPKEVLVIPVATMFTISSLRGTMPGAPSGFGAVIDYVGLLPCLAIIVISAAVTIGFLIFFGRVDEKHTTNDTIWDSFMKWCGRGDSKVKHAFVQTC